MAASLAACTPAASNVDAGVMDAGMSASDAGADAGAMDGGVLDAGTMADAGATVDAGMMADAGAAVDAGMTADAGIADGFGDLMGPCAGLDVELTEMAPSFFANTLDFGVNGYDASELMELTSGAQEIISDGNAGGNSLMSEVFAFEVLSRCEGATLLKTETEVTYINPMGKITDLLVDIDGQKIGVSVTRALAFPFDDPYTVAQADVILRQKLQGVLDSSANVAEADRWHKQILSVIAYSPMHVESLRTAWNALEDEVRADTIVYVTATNGDDAFLY